MPLENWNMHHEPRHADLPHRWNPAISLRFTRHLSGSLISPAFSYHGLHSVAHPLPPSSWFHFLPCPAHITYPAWSRAEIRARVGDVLLTLCLIELAMALASPNERIRRLMKQSANQKAAEHLVTSPSESSFPSMARTRAVPDEIPFGGSLLTSSPLVISDRRILSVSKTWLVSS